MSRSTVVLVPHEVLTRIRATLSRHGELSMTRHGLDDAFVVSHWSGGGARHPVTFRSPPKMQKTEDPTYEATWHRTEESAHFVHWQLTRRPGTCTNLEVFKQLVPTVAPKPGVTNIVLTYVPEDELSDERAPWGEFAAWSVTGDEIVPFAVALEPAAHGLGQLAPAWPVDVLQQGSVLVVGCGSIGGHAAEALAAYGFGTLHLLDPDRLLWHNTVRHLLDDNYVGRLKTDALADHLTQRWPHTDSHSYPLDIATDADRVRTLVPAVDLVLCAADGVAPRRVTSHLAARASRDAVLVSVLEDGAYGEILRLRPRPDHGCLLCRRNQSYETGAMDPERVQERGYGDGDPHRPMTAVGSDLALMGQLAAKVAVATLLQRAGIRGQGLPGERAIVTLRPQPGYAAPFDEVRAANVTWHPAEPPRPGCFTCRTP